MVAFKGLNVILGLYKCNYSLTVKWELGAPLPGRNKVLGHIEQGEGRVWPEGLVFATCALRHLSNTTLLLLKRALKNATLNIFPSLSWGPRNLVTFDKGMNISYLLVQTGSTVTSLHWLPELPKPHPHSFWDLHLWVQSQPFWAHQRAVEWPG